MVITSAVEVHPSNTEQLRAWDGEEGAFWAAHAGYFDRAVARYQPPLLEAAELSPGDRVLDIGCGTGGTARDVARRVPAGSVVGVDLSSAMLDAARRAATREGLTNVLFLQADAQVHRFGAGSFDVAVSRTGCTFFGDPVAAFANIGAALAPAGRLALLVWQAPSRNEWFQQIVGAFLAGRPVPVPPPGSPGPFAFAEPDHVRTVLRAAGFGEIRVRPLTEPEEFGRDVDDAVAFVLGVAGWMLEGLDEDGRAHAVETFRRAAEAHATEDGVVFGSATWLITARRADPGASSADGS
ncbi:class I SAM-dependent methyltransferase [Geodermatophilus sp. YIM 151500]|uniref:class I SAM-dependent methyltransferase n=1 Tax=Geodermatophilus sp. YIM 151500 TaxID=2984531 RepID=UPI0021E4BED4|nr:class I SAM-dependent methyltransferase [Geodermatophilus sp. YIM 151500]MCV2487954.1 class I SAM-dependent methyltransferase [Geodermatophilus sp. YIM 151500]